MSIEQYCEVATFAQFVSDLDAATQHQVLRGGTPTEILNGESPTSRTSRILRISAVRSASAMALLVPTG